MKKTDVNAYYGPWTGSAPDQAKADLFAQADALGLGEIHIKNELATGLRAIIVLQPTQRGPALGGTRCAFYPSAEAALFDAMRLARGMSYKSAFCGLPYSGGKAVLMRPAQILDREAYFASYGRFVESLQGRFVTAVDVGTTVQDMDLIARCTRYVLSTSRGSGDPSPYTAYGVCCGIEAAVKFRLKRDSLKGIHVAVQGVGNVGYHLVRELKARGARLSVCDINDRAIERCVKEFDVKVVAADEIYSLACDVSSPCALGAVLDDSVIDRLKASIICGAANNQLAEVRHGDELHRRGILYAPDYVANAGGLMQVALSGQKDLLERIERIYHSLMQIFIYSEKNHLPTHRVADQMAENLLHLNQSEAG